jgi:hypothetical protein
MKGGLWARKFDYQNGETRECKKCNESFYTKKPIWRCPKCFNAEQKVIQGKIRKERGLKPYYPFDNQGTEASNRFSSIRSAMSKAWKEYEKTGDKSVVIAHYDKQLKEIEENGIWQWIWDRRDDETIKGRTIRSREQIKKELPDTRGYHEY